MRARSFTSRQAAVAFDAEVKARKYKRETWPSLGRETLTAA
jgi:hypothetical protein